MEYNLHEVSDVKMEEILEPEEPLRATMGMETVRELAESIREKGLLQPILLRPRNHMFEIVFGHRRYLAHKILGEGTIKAEVRDISDEECLLLRATENLQREDLSPMEEAYVYGTLRNKLEYTVEEIARKMGKNRLTIKKYLALLKLPETFQNAVNARALSITVANILIDIDDEVLRHYYLQNAVEHGCSQKTAELWLADYQKTKDARYYEAGRGGDELFSLQEAKPIYHACDVCVKAVELKDIKHLVVCPECYKNAQRRRLDVT